MDKFEYLILTMSVLGFRLPKMAIDTPADEKRALDALGAEGWELVSVKGDGKLIYYFKRKKV